MIDAFISSAGWRCTFCGEDLSPAAIVVAGPYQQNRPQIAVCPGCVVELSTQRARLDESQTTFAIGISLRKSSTTTRALVLHDGSHPRFMKMVRR